LLVNLNFIGFGHEHQLPVAGHRVYSASSNYASARRSGQIKKPASGKKMGLLRRTICLFR
jgi:hypothetical protein